MRGDTLKFRDRIPFRVQTQPDYGLARVHFTGVDDGAGMIVLRTTVATIDVTPYTSTRFPSEATY